MHEANCSEVYLKLLFFFFPPTISKFGDGNLTFIQIDNLELMVVKKFQFLVGWCVACVQSVVRVYIVVINKVWETHKIGLLIPGSGTTSQT